MSNIKNIPAPPEKPDPFECCGSGCVPCIFDYYDDRLTQWETEHGTTLQDYLKSLEPEAGSN